MSILTTRTASPREIATEIDQELSNVAYHVNVLADLGLVEIAEEESVRGSVAHFFRAVKRPLIDKSVWRSLDPVVRSTLSGYTLETLFEETAESLRTGVFDEREDRHLSRIPALLDERGWREVVRIQEEAATSILAAQAAAAKRMNGSHQDAIHTVIALYCFEVPPGKAS